MTSKGQKALKRAKVRKKISPAHAQRCHQFWWATVVAAISVALAGLYYMSGERPFSRFLGYSVGSSTADSMTPVSTTAGEDSGAENCDDFRYELEAIEAKALTRGSAATDPLIIELLARDAALSCIGVEERSRLLAALMDRAVEARDWVRMESHYEGLLAMTTSPDERHALWWDVSGHFFKAALDLENEGKPRFAREHYLRALQLLAPLDEVWPGNATILGDIAAITGRLHDPAAVANYERFFK